MEYFLLRKTGTDSFYKHCSARITDGHYARYTWVNMPDATIFKTVGGARRSTWNGLEIVRVEVEPVITGVVD